jgi:hypothetical protein
MMVTVQAAQALRPAQAVPRLLQDALGRIRESIGQEAITKKAELQVKRIEQLCI